ncbi:FAD-linked oxidoreductase hmp9 [Cladobotryum mycophilum]|uniref:FAD-linked oxidoreductase hmp9 n=1 Tax=Cladobotryum mycophilum TaxID=491253 RepID=A0ABR0SUI1_9HYPO
MHSIARLLPLLAILLGCASCQEPLESPVSVANVPQCRCTPGDKCWPSEETWKSFNTTISGKLIKSTPIAESCYPGPAKNLDTCAFVDQMWTDQDFQTEKPIGRTYPFNITCAPVNYTAGETPTTCTLGQLPVYAINATTRRDIATGLDFARSRNLRLTVSSTGHDLLGRGDGYGSLEIWLRYYRNGINFEGLYASADKCDKSGWKGSAIHIDGAFQWRDVYVEAKKHNVIVVGGGSISPGAIGGWPSGGGHGPATRDYGLGADQVLEAEVMLADGQVVLANHCQHTDLFRALRGGGPGFGVVLSAKIKAYPNVNAVTAHHLTLAPVHQTPNNSDLLDAVAILMQAYPGLNDAGYSGYAFWFRNFPRVFVGNATSGYRHGIWMIGKSKEEAERAFAPVRKSLAKFEGKLSVNETFATYPDYWSFYGNESGLYDPVGDTSTLTSRMIDKAAVQDYGRVRETVEVIAGKPEDYASNVVLLVSGGKVFEDAKDGTSGLNPAWRKSPYVIVTGRSIPRVTSQAVRKAVADDITFTKGGAAKKLAPDTGGYMNEGDRNDPDYIKSFYGAMYPAHLATKKKYDPTDTFYCPTCVGAEAFVERSDGKLCRI